MDNVKQAINIESPVSRSRAINGDFGNKSAKYGQIAKIRMDFASHFMDSPDYQSEEEAKVNGIPRKLLVSKHKSELTQKDVIAFPGEEIYLGDVVECFDSHWLVTQKDPNSNIYSSGLIELCNTKIRWQNSETLDIVERWAIIKNPYSTNIKESQTLTTLNGKYELYITKDEESLAVPPDKRFIIGQAGGKPLVYRLTFPDINAETYEGQGNGVIVWNLVSEENVREADNQELMIADYIEPTKSEVKPGEDSSLYKAVISGSNNILVGFFKKYKCNFYDGNNVVQDPENLADIKWSVECDDVLEQFVSIESNMNECTIHIENNDDAINRKLKISCQCENSDIGTYEIECVVM